MVVGVDRLRTTQVVKQADVLMLGVLLPDEVDLRPRRPTTATTSPARRTAARSRRPCTPSSRPGSGDLDDALSYFHLAGGVDLDNRMGNAADGVHIATMGGLWQAAVFGFGGVRADGGAVRIDPRLPAAWAGLTLPHPLAGHPHRGGRAGRRAGAGSGRAGGGGGGPRRADAARPRPLRRPPRVRRLVNGRSGVIG